MTSPSPTSESATFTATSGRASRHAKPSSPRSTIRGRLAQAEPDRADYQRDLSVSYNKVGDLYRDLCQGEQARQAFLTALQIRERLARAEPDRADYQRDLAVSLVRVGTIDGDTAAGVVKLRRALEILKGMQGRGQLAPVSEGMVDWVRNLLNEIENA